MKSNDFDAIFIIFIEKLWYRTTFSLHFVSGHNQHSAGAWSRPPGQPEYKRTEEKVVSIVCWLWCWLWWPLAQRQRGPGYSYTAENGFQPQYRLRAGRHLQHQRGAEVPHTAVHNGASSLQHQHDVFSITHFRARQWSCSGRWSHSCCRTEPASSPAA